jgi:hypothetical protein
MFKSSSVQGPVVSNVYSLVSFQWYPLGASTSVIIGMDTDPLKSDQGDLSLSSIYNQI